MVSHRKNILEIHKIMLDEVAFNFKKLLNHIYCISITYHRYYHYEGHKRDVPIPSLHNTRHSPLFPGILQNTIENKIKVTFSWFQIYNQKISLLNYNLLTFSLYAYSWSSDDWVACGCFTDKSLRAFFSWISRIHAFFTCCFKFYLMMYVNKTIMFSFPVG